MGPDRTLEDALRNLLPDDLAPEELDTRISTLRMLVEADRWIPALRTLGLSTGVGRRLRELLKELQDAEQKLDARRQQLSLSLGIMIPKPKELGKKVDSLKLIKDGNEEMCLSAVSLIKRIPPSHSGHFNNLGCAYAWLKGLDHAGDAEKAFQDAQDPKKQLYILQDPELRTKLNHLFQENPGILSISPRVMIKTTDGSEVDSLELIEGGVNPEAAKNGLESLAPDKLHAGHFNNLGCAYLYLWLDKGGTKEHLAKAKEAFEEAQQAKRYAPPDAKPAKEAAAENLVFASICNDARAAAIHNLKILEEAKKRQEEINSIQREIKRILGS
jgi:hypothetical protein